MSQCKELEGHKRTQLACMIEANVSEPEIEKFRNSGLNATEANANIKCMLKCMMEKRDLFQNGVFDGEKAFTEFIKSPENKGQEAGIKEAINVCKTEKGANDCDTAFKITMCLHEFKSRNQ